VCVCVCVCVCELCFCVYDFFLTIGFPYFCVYDMIGGWGTESV
jgi:hypothetical protein